MVELRKRPAPPPAPPPAKKKAAPKAKATKPEPAAVEPAAEAEAPTAPAVTSATTNKNAHKAGDSITLDGFGGEVETNDGIKTTLAKLVAESTSGVVLFTYPKASTPGCTTQVCLFRDAYKPLTATGLTIYGLSTDSPKANTTFKTKQNLPYPLLCDPEGKLIQAIGMKKAPKGTTRGVFVVDKSGKVLAAEPGGPAATVEVVKGIVGKMGGDTSAQGIEKAGQRAVTAMVESIAAENKLVASVAAEVADTAATMDRSKTGTPA